MLQVIPEDKVKREETKDFEFTGIQSYKSPHHDPCLTISPPENSSFHLQIDGIEALTKLKEVIEFALKKIE